MAEAGRRSGAPKRSGLAETEDAVSTQTIRTLDRNSHLVVDRGPMLPSTRMIFVAFAC